MQTTIWMVDDDESVREILSLILSHALPGLDIVVFSSPVRLLEAYEALPDESRPRLVLTDNSMPEMNGTDLSRELRRRKSDQRILMVSGDNGLKCPDADRIIAKPFANSGLVEAVRSLL